MSHQLVPFVVGAPRVNGIQHRTNTTMTATQALKKAMDTECKVFIDVDTMDEIAEILSVTAKQLTPCSFQLNGYDVWFDCEMTEEWMEDFVMARKID